MSKDLQIITDIKKKKLKIKKEINEKIYNLCINTIKLYVVNNKYECIYNIPFFIFGLPKYNIKEVAKYIINKLEKDKLLIYFFEPNILYINWYDLT